jgi:hypothetical protein
MRFFPTIVVALVAVLTLPASAKATTFTDNFSPPSTLWSNSIGNWTGGNGRYYAQAPSNSPETYSGLPFDFTNSNFSLTITINSLRDEGIWLDTDGSRNNGILFVAGGNAQQGNIGQFIRTGHSATVVWQKTPMPLRRTSLTL